MKKIISVITLIAIVSIFCFANSKNISLFVDSKPYAFRGNCEIYRGRTYATTDFYKNALGVEVEIKGKNISIRKDDIKIDAQVGSSVYRNGDDKVSTKEAVYKKNGGIFLPLKVIVNMLNYQIDYKDDLGHKVISVAKSGGVRNGKYSIETHKSQNIVVSNDNKWEVWSEQYYEQNNPSPKYVVYLKNNETEEIKEIYTSEKVITEILIWTKDNKLIMGSYKDRAGKNDRFHVVEYDPTVEKIRMLVDFKNKYDYDFFYSGSENALLYRDYSVKKKEAYKVIYLDTNKIEEISAELYNILLKER